MVQCNRCNLQYIGETKRRLKDRFNEHTRAVDKTNIKSKPTTVSEHFLSHSNHSLACEPQTHFRSSLLSLFVGGREATTGNASAVRRLTILILTCS